MKISKWVDFGQEVEINIDAHDVSAALSEAFERATEDPLGEEPDRAAVLRAMGNIGTFLKAISDEQIRQMTDGQRRTIGEFLGTQAKRYGKDRGGTASMIVSSVCNEHRNSDLRADNPAIMRAFNERFEVLEDQRDELRRALNGIYTHCVAISASDPKLSDSTRASILRIGELSAPGNKREGESAAINGRLGEKK